MYVDANGNYVQGTQEEAEERWKQQGYTPSWSSSGNSAFNPFDPSTWSGNPIKDIWNFASGTGDMALDQIVEDLTGDNSGAGVPGAGADDDIIDENGNFKNKKLQQAKDLIDATARYNNEWSAEQAAIQRDWQKMMSDSAHQREVADLQAAGLNPVLSSGGQGASTPSGAMGQTDTSNTRLIGELAMSAIQGLSGAAIGGSAGAASGGLFGWMRDNRQTINTINNVVRTGISIAKLFGF